MIAELDARARAADNAGPHEPESVFPSGRSEFVADHVAVVLSCTKAVAGRRYDTAVEVVRLPSLMAAWSAGRIDERKVAVIVEGLRPAEPCSPMCSRGRQRSMRLTAHRQRCDGGSLEG